jgi:hypothetical protein
LQERHAHPRHRFELPSSPPPQGESGKGGNRHPLSPAPSRQQLATHYVPGYLSGQHCVHAWYRKTFTLRASPAASRIKLCFGGVKFGSNVRANGTLVGPHHPSSTWCESTGRKNRRLTNTPCLWYTIFCGVCYAVPDGCQHLNICSRHSEVKDEGGRTVGERILLVNSPLADMSTTSLYGGTHFA